MINIYKQVSENFNNALNKEENKRLTLKEKKAVEFYELFYNAVEERIMRDFDDARCFDGGLSEEKKEDLLTNIMNSIEDSFGSGESSKKAYWFINKMVDEISEDAEDGYC